MSKQVEECVRIILCMMFVFGVSCTRKKSDTTQVVFQVPSAGNTVSNFTLLDFEDSVDDVESDNEWSPIVPSGISTGDFPINCYILMVGGPEAEFKLNKCGRKIVGGSEDSMDEMFKFGPWLGAIPVSSAATGLQMELNAGSGRTFYLVGFHALNANACVSFQNSDPMQTQLTRPHLIGKVENVTLDPGTTKTISILQTLDREAWFDSCKFDSKTNPTTENKATTMLITKMIETGSFLTSATAGQICEPYKIRFVDDTYKPAPVAANTQVELMTCEGNSGDDPGDPPRDCVDLADPVLAVTATFATKDDCIATTNSAMSLSILSSEQSVTRWIRTPNHTPNTHFTMRVRTAANQPALETSKVYRYVLLADDVGIVRLHGTKNLIEGLCYKYDASFRLMAGGDAAMPSYAGSISSVELWRKNLTNNTYEDISSGHLFSNSTCTSSYDPTTAPWTNEVFYIKGPAASYNLQLKFNYDTPLFSVYQQMTSTASSYIGTHLRTYSSQFLATNICSRIEVHVANMDGAAARVVLAAGKVIRLVDPATDVSLNGGDLEFFSDPLCATPLDLTATGGTTIAQGEYKAVFYIKNTRSGPGELYRKIKFTDQYNLTAVSEFIIFSP